MSLSTAEISAIAGSSSTAPERSVHGYSIDSRTAQAGDLFFAIRGPRHDGHDFIGQAFERGAVAVVVDNTCSPPPLPYASSIIRVPDTTRALQQLAREVRRRWGGPVIGITGSTGKTTTKEMLAAVLETKFCVLKSRGNLNNQYGVPLTLLGLEPRHEVAVVEMGMSGPGEIALLADIAGPETGIVTNVAPVHLQFFDSVDSIARAKRELIDRLQPPRAAILNYDDERVRRFADGFEGQVVTFGFHPDANFQAVNVHAAHVFDQGSPAIGFELRVGDHLEKFVIPLPGRHNVENALAAIATAGLFGIAPQEARAALAQFRPLDRRSGILKPPNGLILIDDAYNSNPRAMEQMIEVLATWPNARQRIVLAGEMLELGASSPELHRRVGRLCAQAGADWLLAVQGDARAFLDGAVEAGMPHAHALFFAGAMEAAKFCQTIAKPGDVILIKGSRGVGLEKAIEVLSADGPSA
ncbi:MAG: UDP-N-acetylmuramoyl-tripeptide--D-alanyl-D-alanine ligase [Terriglobia bacterium]